MEYENKYASKGIAGTGLGLGKQALPLKLFPLDKWGTFEIKLSNCANGETLTE